MRKFFFFTLVALSLSMTNSFSQDRKNVVKLNLWSPVVSTLNLSYERVIAEKVSVQLGFGFTGKNFDDTKYRGYQIQPEVRFYLSDKSAPAGFYIAPFARYRNLSLTAPVTTATMDGSGNVTTSTRDVKVAWNSFGGGVVIGGQWLFANERVALGIFGGPAFYGHSFDYKDGATEANFSLKGTGGFSFRSGLTLGVAF